MSVFGSLSWGIFSGEATHELYNGYVHGGYLTGVEEAEKIAYCIETGLCLW